MTTSMSHSTLDELYSTRRCSRQDPEEPVLQYKEYLTVVLDSMRLGALRLPYPIVRRLDSQCWRTAVDDRRTMDIARQGQSIYRTRRC